MKHHLLTTIAAVLLGVFVFRLIMLMTQPSIHEASRIGNLEVVKQHLADGVDVNAKDKRGRTSLYWAAIEGHTETANLLHKHGDKTGE